MQREIHVVMEGSIQSEEANVELVSEEIEGGIIVTVAVNKCPLNAGQAERRQYVKIVVNIQAVVDIDEPEMANGSVSRNSDERKKAA